jgi:hypothetical protein
VVFACVSPKGDYDDYTKRSEPFKMTVADSGPIDSMAPTNSVKGTYYLACLPFLAFGNVDQQFRFYVDSEFTPNMGGGGGKLTLKLTPMIIRDANMCTPDCQLIPNANLTLKDEMKGVLSVTDVPVDGTGKFNANFMTAMVDHLSNPISDRNITVMNTSVAGIFQAQPDGGPAAYCGGLSGQVTMPISQDLGAPSQNPCLFVPLTLGSMLPTRMADDFKCPGI